MLTRFLSTTNTQWSVRESQPAKQASACSPAWYSLKYCSPSFVWFSSLSVDFYVDIIYYIYLDVILLTTLYQCASLPWWTRRPGRPYRPRPDRGTWISRPPSTWWSGSTWGGKTSIRKATTGWKSSSTRRFTCRPWLRPSWWWVRVPTRILRISLSIYWDKISDNMWK